MPLKLVHKIALAQVYYCCKLLNGDVLLKVFFDVLQSRTNHLPCFLKVRNHFRLRFQQPEKAEQFSTQKHVQLWCVPFGTGKDRFYNRFHHRIIMMLWCDVHLYLHTAGGQRLYAFLYATVGF